MFTAKRHLLLSNS